MTTRPDRGGDPPPRPGAVTGPATPPVPGQPTGPDPATSGTAPAAPGPDATGTSVGAAQAAAAPDGATLPDAATGPAATPTRDRAQYAVCAFLAVVGGLVIVDAARTGHAISTADPIGPKPVPILLGVLLLIVAAIYTVDVARGGSGEPEAGEDVDLTTPIDWRTVLLLIGAFLVNAVLIDRLGWVISGTLLFWGSAFALGNRHHVRNLVIAVALSLITFYTFAIGLGVNLPAGVLQGIL
ncbi:tripartite tricarboxylate transporter TctB family protein [Micromonospora purpureochromogenes]|uniref:Tricarboxylic transport membrane protein n=1 Tax=Micromonospora purpureochromogenes TaxID=47872 RepID=A0ABX2RJA7_9ACTN|nr:tripartite tricarboxylate transporter TctB family protein [Micromonospora purpureochromogenes]NYF55497.1 putative tricarboxylic transport membrane protein [Micromonospora purpureochromogenes]